MKLFDGGPDLFQVGDVVRGVQPRTVGAGHLGGQFADHRPGGPDRLGQRRQQGSGSGEEGLPGQDEFHALRRAAERVASDEAFQGPDLAAERGAGEVSSLA